MKENIPTVMSMNIATRRIATISSIRLTDGAGANNHKRSVSL